MQSCQTTQPLLSKWRHAQERLPSPLFILVNRPSNLSCLCARWIFKPQRVTPLSRNALYTRGGGCLGRANQVSVELSELIRTTQATRGAYYNAPCFWNQYPSRYECGRMILTLTLFQTPKVYALPFCAIFRNTYVLHQGTKYSTCQFLYSPIYQG